MKLVWSPLAIRRVSEIVDFISQDSPRAAGSWVEGLFDLVEQVGTFPDRGRVVPEVGRSWIRELIYGDYRVIYKVQATTISVLTVRHGKRRFDHGELKARR